MLNGARTGSALVRNASSQPTRSVRVQEMIKQLAKLREEKLASKASSGSVHVSRTTSKTSRTATEVHDGSSVVHEKGTARPVELHRAVTGDSRLVNTSPASDSGNDGISFKATKKQRAIGEGARRLRPNARSDATDESTEYSGRPRAKSTVSRSRRIPSPSRARGPDLALDKRRFDIDRVPTESTTTTKETIGLKTTPQDSVYQITFELNDLRRELEDIETTTRPPAGVVDDSAVLSNREIAESTISHLSPPSTAQKPEMTRTTKHKRVVAKSGLRARQNKRLEQSLSPNGHRDNTHGLSSRAPERDLILDKRRFDDDRARTDSATTTKESIELKTTPRSPTEQLTIELDDLRQELEYLETSITSRTDSIDDSAILSDNGMPNTAQKPEMTRTTKHKRVVTKSGRRARQNNQAKAFPGLLDDAGDDEFLFSLPHDTPSPSSVPELLEPSLSLSGHHDNTHSLRSIVDKKSRKQPRLTTTDVNFRLVTEAALAVLSILEKHKIKCALFGSFASKLYGTPRMPNDVDLLAFPKHGTTDEHIKRLIAKDKRFSLKYPKNRKNKYRILWYRRPKGSHHRISQVKDKLRECKVDILVPGTMDLPDLGVRTVGVRWFAVDKSFLAIEGEVKENWRSARDLPVLPFPVVLLHKLQGWSDHRVDPQKHKRVKQHQDVEDVRNLLALETEVDKLIVPAFVSPALNNTPTATSLKSLVDIPPESTAPSTNSESESPLPVLSPFHLHPVWSNTKFFPPSFLEVSKKRIRLYCHYFPETRETWARLGFEVHPRNGEVEAEAEEVERSLKAK